MKTTLRTEYSRRVGMCYNGVFQNENILHTNDLAVKQIAGKSTKDIMFATDANAVANVVDSVVKTCRGELALDKTRGIPYFESAFGARGDISEWTAWTSKAIRETNGVDAVRNFDAAIKKVGKKYTIDYSATIETKWGNVKSEAGSVQLSYSDEYTIPRDQSLTKFYVKLDGPVNFYMRVTLSENAEVGYVYFADGERIAVDRETYDKVVYQNGEVVVLKRFSKAGRYMVALDGGFSRFRTGRSDDDVESKGVVIRAFSWGDSITSADKTYLGCFKGSTKIPYSIPSWGENITSAVGTYKGCTMMAAPQVPDWPDGMTDITECYDGCENITNGIEIGTEYTLLDFIVSINGAIDFYGLSTQFVKLSEETGTMTDVISTYNALRSNLIGRDPEVASATQDMNQGDTPEQARVKFNTLIESY